MMGTSHSIKEIANLFFRFENLESRTLIESPVKMMKNAIYFILKAFFVPKIFKLLS